MPTLLIASTLFPAMKTIIRKMTSTATQAMPVRTYFMILSLSADARFCRPYWYVSMVNTTQRSARDPMLTYPMDPGVLLMNSRTELVATISGTPGISS